MQHMSSPVIFRSSSRRKVGEADHIMQHMSSPVRFRSSRKDATFSEKESTSRSIEDQEDTRFPYAMRDLPPISQPCCQHKKPDHQAPVQRGAEGTGRSVNRHPSLHETPNLSRAFQCNPTASAAALKRPSRVGQDADLQFLRRHLSSQQDQTMEYVGFASLPDQVHRKTVKKGFLFTLLVAGESGLGKSTLINSLFLTDLNKDRRVPNAHERIDQTVDIIKHTVRMEEKGVKMRLTIVDTPGFGDAVDSTEDWNPIEDYIDEQFEQYFRDESGLNRMNIQDNRVHCCLYFISPFGHGLRPLDVECMKALHTKVNIIPVLAKADSLTQAELHRKKLHIKQEIEHLGIHIYQFPDCDSDEEDDIKNQDQTLKDSIPFALIGSNIQVETECRTFRGRVYPWGVVDVENPAHSDFLLLRNMLVRTHMQDLKDVTGDTHYENYRALCIQSMTRVVVLDKKRSLREKHQEHKADFPLPLAPPDSQNSQRLFEKDEELRRMQEVLERVQEQMQHSQRGGF